MRIRSYRRRYQFHRARGFSCGETLRMFREDWLRKHPEVLHRLPSYRAIQKTDVVRELQERPPAKEPPRAAVSRVRFLWP